MDTQSSSWTVIQFIEDGTVEAVPSSWIQGEFCHWPSYAPQKLISAIRKCEELNTCWPSHKVKHFRNSTFDDYTKARGKAKVAEETSDLNTDDPENTPKRKRTQRIMSSDLSSDDSLDECLTLTAPPTIKKINKKLDNCMIEENSVKQKNRQEPSQKNDNHKPSKDSCHDNEVSQCNKCNEKDKNFKVLLQQNHILRGLMTDTLHEIKQIKEQLAQNLPKATKTNQFSLFKSPGINFPINSDEEFELLESVLCSEEDFQNSADELSKLGGSSTYDLIKRILTLILSNDQTLKYSWLGRKGKRPFHKSNIARLLIKSVEQSGIGRCTKEAEIAIQAWLRRASDRRSRQN